MTSVILFVVTVMSLLILVAAETGASEPLPSKMTCASAGISAFWQCLPSRCVANDHIPSQYIYIYIYIERERERERDGDREINRRQMQVQSTEKQRKSTKNTKNAKTCHWNNL
jgi:hypothetical protein